MLACKHDSAAFGSPTCEHVRIIQERAIPYVKWYIESGLKAELLLPDVRKALKYLEDRKLSVNETAYLFGFSERATFSREFKRWIGQSPGAIRKRKA